MNRRSLLLMWAAEQGPLEPRPKRYLVACLSEILVRVGLRATPPGVTYVDDPSILILLLRRRQAAR